ncbi:MAG: GAF domain-containing sensor histidine kinase [Chloroflexi bacterium]|nr:GAF domain-containing sensor histidine kinase [Chloroflexota bacterium]
MTTLRWIMPITLAVFGIGYPLWEGIVVDGYVPYAPQVVIGVVLLGVVGPLAIFFTLTWAMRAAASLERAAHDRERQHQQLVALNAIGEAVNQSLELNAVLECALDRVLNLLRLESGEVRLLDDGKLVLGAVRGVSPEFIAAERVVPFGQCVCGKAAQTGQLIAIEDIGRAPTLALTACACERFRSVLTVPVRTADRVVGVLHVGSHVPRMFDASDRALLTAIGQQVGVAIEKARLHAQLKVLNHELETRVTERTGELVAAKEELAHKADALRQVLAEERRVEEKTRARIAHDLHDSVQQLIIGALFETQAARDALAAHPESAQMRLGETQNLLRRIEAEMRGAIYSLRPVALDTHGLVPALRELVASFERVAGIQCELRVDGAPRRFDPEAEVAVFRVTQESLNNVEAHAQAQHVYIVVSFGARDLRVEIRDDGRGFDSVAVMREPRTHLGLIGMRERAETIGGDLDVWSQVGVGTRIVLKTPIAQ